MIIERRGSIEIYQDWNFLIHTFFFIFFKNKKKEFQPDI